jgi:ubiquinone biosynthesis protein UbiJ
MDSFLMDILKSAPQTGVIIVMLWYGQKGIVERIDKMARRMDCFEQSQHACQLANLKDFASKEELASLESKVDRHESRISRIEGKV